MKILPNFLVERNNNQIRLELIDEYRVKKLEELLNKLLKVRKEK